MNQPRMCTICHEELIRRAFWDNLNLHKDCLDRLIREEQERFAAAEAAKESSK